MKFGSRYAHGRKAVAVGAAWRTAHLNVQSNTCRRAKRLEASLNAPLSDAVVGWCCQTRGAAAVIR